MGSPYLFTFGYESPTQAANNEAHGWDDEDSGAVSIVADSPAHAEHWGEEIAEEFIRRLYSDDSVSWREKNYSRRIIDDPESTYAPESLAALQTVALGQYPDWSRFP